MKISYTIKENLDTSMQKGWWGVSQFQEVQNNTIFSPTTYWNYTKYFPSKKEAEDFVLIEKLSQ
jgi:hypothetical protein